MTSGNRFILQIRAEPRDIPETIRLRHLLKRMLRDLGFRCERITLAAEPTQTTSEQTQEGEP